MALKPSIRNEEEFNCVYVGNKRNNVEIDNHSFIVIKEVDFY